MKMVILDGYALNPGDLDYAPLGRLGELTVYDFTRSEEVVERARGAEALFTNKTRLSGEVLAQLPGLRYIGVLATGYDVVDIQAARARGIAVTNIPCYGTDSVAQMVFAHILNLAHQVEHHARGVAQGRWSASRDFCYWDKPLIELAGKTVGIVGFGRIGRRVGEIARAFGMRVVACDSGAALPEWAEALALPELLAQSDVVTLHCPLTAATRGLINRDTLKLMKPTAFLINTSRGPLIAAADLAAALQNGVIAAAGLDVLEVEPPPADCPLFGLDRCRITPHIAWATLEARTRLLRTAIDNLERFLAGNPVNVVNP